MQIGTNDGANPIINFVICIDFDDVDPRMVINLGIDS